MKKKFYVIVAIYNGDASERWRFSEKISKGSPIPFKNKSEYRSVMIYTFEEALERHFVNSEGELLFYGFPGTGSTNFIVIGFDDDDAALEAAISMENNFMGII